MTAFSVRSTARFEREYKALVKRHPDLDSHFRKAVEILRQDPYNHSRAHPIKKLQGIAPGEGQYRIRLGRFRLRYDIEDQTVFLVYCGLRREDTYS